jgi:hypothetical protein
VKGWHAALLALPIWFAPPAGAAEDLISAARELGRRTASASGREAVGVTWRNLSSIGSAAAGEARTAFEASLRESGSKAADAAGGPVEAQVTISENASAYLLVEEFRKGDERQVWMATWRRAGGGVAAPAASVEKRLLWEQQETVLDAATVGDSLLVLTPTALIRTTPRQSAPIAWSKPWPRDLRGRLRVSGDTVQVFLPGIQCTGNMEPLNLQCKASDSAWGIETGGRLLLANYAASRNYFDGRVATESGQKAMGAFYSAAAADAFWILTMVDGRAEIFDAALDPLGNAGAWGSDLAAADTRCGGNPVVLATRPGDGPDAIQAFAIANRSATAVGQPLEVPGQVTALWSPGTAVVRSGNQHQVYAITVSCGP